MPSTFSQSLRIELVGTGEQSGVWGVTTNNNLGDLIEQAITGNTEVDVTLGNVTLTALNGVVDEARSAVLTVTGTPGTTRVITIPNVKKPYTVRNDSDATVQIKTASGTAYDCPVLSESYIYCDGANVVTGRSFTGDEVNGPASSTDNSLARFDGATGKLIQNSGVTIDDSNNVSGVAQLNATTVDTTNIEVTNIKAKDGTAAASIADSTGVITVPSAVLTTVDINGGTIDGTVIGGASAAAGTFTTLTAPSAVLTTVDINGGTIDGATIGVTSAASGRFTTLSYTGTLTGGTGVVNIGSGQLYKTSAGLFGIGTTSPSDRVHLYGSQQVVRIESSSSTDALVRTKTTLGDWGAGTGIGSADNSWSVYNYGTSTRPFVIGSNGVSTFERSGEGNAAKFISNGNNTGQGGQIELRNSYPSGNPQSKFLRVNDSGFLDIVNNAYSAIVMSVTDAGAAFQGNNSSTWSVSSDERIKTNKRSINDALGKIKSLQPCHFEYKNAIGKTRTGFIAQEFEQTFPGHVTEATAPMEFHDFIDGDDKTIKSIDANLVPYLVAAIKELSAQVDILSAEVATLKAK